jgi:hypothetical protein
MIIRLRQPNRQKIRKWKLAFQGENFPVNPVHTEYDIPVSQITPDELEREMTDGWTIHCMRHFSVSGLSYGCWIAPSGITPGRRRKWVSNRIHSLLNHFFQILNKR